MTVVEFLDETIDFKLVDKCFIRILSYLVRRLFDAKSSKIGHNFIDNNILENALYP